MKKFLRIFWIVFASGILFVIIFFWMVARGAFGTLPTFEELENPKSSLATEVYTNDLELLGKYYAQNRSPATYQELPQNLVDALMATEDARYYKHSGIDFKALARVVKGVLTFSSTTGGGSTISQQLAKNLFPRESLNKIGLVMRKFKEWIIAARLERSYTKEEIMVMYLNTVEFSDNAFGIKSAAKTYFNKPVDSLRVEESAVLVGMLQAPYRFNPRLHPEESTVRRNVVLAQMARYGYITEEQKDSLQALPLNISFTRTDHIEGLAPYFRESLRQFLIAWCNDPENLKPDGSKWDIYRDGLKIYTTLDSKLQTYAEKAVEDHLTEMQDLFFQHWKGKDPWKNYEEQWEMVYTTTPSYRHLEDSLPREIIDSLLAIPKPMKVFSLKYGEVDTMMSVIDSVKYMRMQLQSGFMVMDPKTGYVKAWVGGHDYKYFQYDHVTSERQVGSTFKPFVYAVAISQKGYSPCFQIPNELVTFEKENPKWNLLKDWTPKNSGGGYGGMFTLKKGLAQSVNTITAYLMHETGPGPVRDLAQNMGITADIPMAPSICLGTADISVKEMVGAYTAFANKGIYTEPIFVSRIEDKNGNIIAEFFPEKREVLDEQTAYVMLELLRGVVKGGTGQRLGYKYGLSGDMAGKTGTTQNQSDGWFMGMTPDLIAGAWVGCEDRFVRFRTITYGQGAALALPVWAKFFQYVYADTTTGYTNKNTFEKPDKDDMTIELDCSKYEQDNPYTGEEGYGDEYQ